MVSSTSFNIVHHIINIVLIRNTREPLLLQVPEQGYFEPIRIVPEEPDDPGIPTLLLSAWWFTQHYSFAQTHGRESIGWRFPSSGGPLIFTISLLHWGECEDFLSELYSLDSDFFDFNIFRFHFCSILLNTISTSRVWRTRVAVRRKWRDYRNRNSARKNFYMC